MDWVEIFRHCAFLAVISTIFFGYLLYHRTKHTKSARISHSAVTDLHSYLLLSVGVSVGTLLLGLSVYGYMLQELQLPTAFFFVFGILLFLVLVTAWVPDVKGWKHTVHHWTAWIMSYLMLSAVAMLYVDSLTNSSVDEFSIALLAFALLFPIALASVGTYTNLDNLSPKKALHSQQLYFLIFQVAVVVRVYLG